MDSDDELKRLYEKTRDELTAGQRANAEQFDRSILTLSAGFLAISIGFIGNIVDPENVKFQWILHLSWVLFGLTIIVTLRGMIYGQQILKELLESAHDYYIEKNPDAYDDSATLSKKIDRVNRAVSNLFTLAVALTIIFAVLNSGGEYMATKRTENVEAAETVKRSQPANTFQKPSGGTTSGEQTQQEKTDAEKKK